jgi:hypothetical protein
MDASLLADKLLIGLTVALLGVMLIGRRRSGRGA